VRVGTMNSGWIRLHRKLLVNPIKANPLAVALWIHILLRANHQNKELYWNDKLICCNRGQFITGRKRLSEQTGIAQHKIEKLLKDLEKMGKITQQKTNKYRIITVLNYNIYQSRQQQTNNKPTTNQQQTNTNNNIKNDIKNDNNIYKEIINYLNQRANKKFTLTTSYKKYMKARIQEGRTIEDFKKVIDNKVSDQYFLDNPKYLNPITLFRPSNFDRYLNDVPDVSSKSKLENIYKNESY